MGTGSAIADRQALLAVVGPLRRVVAARVADPLAAEDVVQETLARLLDHEKGLDDASVLPYAIVTARNIVASQVRHQQIWRRHAPRLIDLTGVEDPEQVALRREEERALAVALHALPEGDRRILVDHEIHGTDTKRLADQSQSTPGAVAARLARSRARLRVDYVVALRRVSPPTAQCRPVLLALSAGDRRRQRALGAGEHLLVCSTCADLSEPLLERQRALAGLVWLPLAALARGIRSSHSAQVGVAGTAVAVAVVAAVAAAQPGSPPRAAVPPTAGAGAAPPPPYLTVDGEPLLPLAGSGGLAGRAGRPAVGTGAVVQSVVAGEGFWVGESGQDRVWIELADLVVGQPVLPPLRPGSRVSFGGRVAANTADYLAEARADGIDGVDQIEREGAHIDVDPAALTLN
ncbi:MAG: sigma-70 family RNA polymerase sigma factor [Actinomycetota bacterium]|nr:sigma-70 family RNA polymerase sigma factor [Actinomycetota bacterium]